MTMFSEESNGFTGWVLAGIGAIVSTLLTGVVTLFRMRESENSKAIVKLETSLTEVSTRADKCEQDRQTLFTQCEVMKFKIDMLEQRVSNIDVQGTQYSKVNK